MDKLVVQMHSFRTPTNRKLNFLSIPPPTKVPRIALGTVIIPAILFVQANYFTILVNLYVIVI